MLTKPQGYDQAQSIEGDGGEYLEPGGYLCKILRVQEQMSRNGNPMFVFEFDIVQGDRVGFFKRKYDRSIKANPKAKWGGCIYQSVSSDYGIGRLKGMITSIELSNLGFMFDWNNPQNEKTLAGKLVGVVFGEEEYKNDKGEKKKATKPFWMCSADKIREGVEVPKPRLLKEEDSIPAASSIPLDFDEDFKLMADDDEVPF